MTIPIETSGTAPAVHTRRAIAAVGALAIFALAARLIVLQGGLRGALERLAALGPMGAALFVLLYVVVCLLLLPASLLTLGAGAVYGVARGIPLVSVSATLGATVAFIVGRTVARGWVQVRVERDSRFKAIDQAVAREGWKIVLLSRLSPAFPFTLINYLFGVTRVSLRDYVLASWLGMLPGTALYVYVGALAGDIADIGSRGRVRTPLEWTYYGIGLVATLAVTLYLTQVARKALASVAAENGIS